MTLSKLTVVLGLVIVLATIVIITWQIHWAFGSTVLGILVMLIGCLIPEEDDTVN